MRSQRTVSLPVPGRREVLGPEDSADVGAARCWSLIGLTPWCSDVRMGPDATRSTSEWTLGVHARQRAAVRRWGAGDSPPLMAFEAPLLPASAWHWRRRVFAGGRVPSACAAPACGSVPGTRRHCVPCRGDLGGRRRVTPASQGALPGSPRTVITCSCNCCGEGKPSGGFASNHLFMDRRWQCAERTPGSASCSSLPRRLHAAAYFF